MARQPIPNGSADNDGTGIFARTAFGRIEANFLEVYGAIPVPDMWDRWIETHFGIAAPSGPMWAATAINGGSNGTAPAGLNFLGYNPHGVYLRSSGTTGNTNSGYRYITGNAFADSFGVQSRKFRAQFMSTGGLSGRTVRIGFHNYTDATTFTGANNGAWFEMVDGVVSCKTATAGTVSTHATTYTTTLTTPYTFEIDVNAAGTSARFRLYEARNTTPVLDVTLTTNIPTGTNRVANGIVATYGPAIVSSTVVDVGVLYSLGFGTVEAFNRAKAGLVA